MGDSHCGHAGDGPACCRVSFGGGSVSGAGEIGSVGLGRVVDDAGGAGSGAGVRSPAAGGAAAKPLTSVALSRSDTRSPVGAVSLPASPPGSSTWRWPAGGVWTGRMSSAVDPPNDMLLVDVTSPNSPGGIVSGIGVT